MDSSVFRRLRRLWTAFWTRLDEWRERRADARRKRERQAGAKLALERFEDRAVASDVSGVVAIAAVATVTSFGSTALLGRPVAGAATTTTSSTGTGLFAHTPGYQPVAIVPPQFDAPDRHSQQADREERASVTTSRQAQTQQKPVAFDPVLDPLAVEALFDAEGNLRPSGRSWADRALGGGLGGGGVGGGSDGGSTGDNDLGGGVDVFAGAQPASPAGQADDLFSDSSYLQQLAGSNGLFGSPQGQSNTVTPDTTPNTVPVTPTPVRDDTTPGPNPTPRPRPLYKPTRDHAYGALKLSFVANDQGEHPDAVKFTSRGPAASAFFTQDGLTLAITRKGSDGRPTAEVVRLDFVGINPDAEIVGIDPQQGTVSSNGGAAQVTYGGLLYKNAYRGIDIRWIPSTVNGQQWRYDYIVHGGADVSQIRMKFSGGDDLALRNDGSLRLRTAHGALVSQKPVLYQDGPAGRRLVQGGYRKLADGTVGFQITGQYDRTRTLVIDPTISYASYIGGAGQDTPLAVAVDEKGQAFIGGWTSSAAFPPDPDSSNTTFYFQAFIAKVSNTGSRLEWTTFLGTSGATQVEAIALDAAGNVVVAGTTGDTALPTTSGAFRSSHAGGGQDGWVAVLNPLGTVNHLTYLGGSGSDYVHALAVDAAGFVYLGGSTGSSDLPVVGVPGQAPIQDTFGGGSTDGFIAVLKPDLSTQVFDTFIGGGGFGLSAESVNAIALDGAGNVYVGGSSPASSLPGVSGSPAGSGDGFILKIDGQGIAPLWGRWVGGTGSDAVQGLAVAADGSVYVSGAAGSGFPLVNNAYSTGNSFAARVAADGQSVLWSTLLPDTLSLGWAGLAGLAGGGIVVAAPVFTGSNVGVWAFAADGTVSWTYAFGGTSGESPAAVTTDLAGNVYLVGSTYSSDFPVRDAFQATYSGTQDGFIAKIIPTPVATLTAITTDSGTSSTDYITNDNTLVLSGTAPSGATVKVYAAGSTLLGSTTAGGGDTWSLDLTGSAWASGSHAIQVRATLSGETGPWSEVVWVSVDSTAPVVTLTTDGTTTTKSPHVKIQATDAVALHTTYAFDVDLNNDGDYLDTDETNYQTGTLTGDGKAKYAYLNVSPHLALGSYKFRARVQDVAGNEGTSATKSVTVTSVGTPWTITTTTVQVDPTVGDPRAVIGNLNAVHRLDLDKSPGTGVGGDPVLSYNSSRVTVKPVVQVRLQTDNGAALPGTFDVVLTWDGSAQATESYSTSNFAPGDVLTFAQQVSSAVTSTGRYSWSVAISWAGAGSPVTATGSSFVVTADASEFGAGWSFGPVDKLVDIAASGALPAGKLRVFGWHDYAFYQGTNTFVSPAGDDGTLVLLGGGGYLSTRADGRTWEFDSSGKLIKFTSADGTSAITYTYASGRLATMQTPDGGISTFAYDGSDKLASIAAPGSRTYSFTVDGSGDLVNIVDPHGGRRTMGYDADHKLTSDQYGTRKVTHAFDYGMLSSSTSGAGSSNASSFNLTPLSKLGLGGNAFAGQPFAEQQDGQGRKRRTEHDDGGRTTSATDGQGNTTSFGRNAHGRIVVVTDAIGRTTTYTLDAQDYTTQTEYADGGVAAATYGSTYHDQMTGVDERGYTTTYGNDAYGRLVTTTDPMGHVSTTAYNVAGLVETFTDHLGRVTSYGYDAARRLQTITDPTGAVQTFAYDNAGNLNAVTDALGRITTTAYDLAQRPVTTTDALGNVTTNVFDASGNLSETVDARGTRTAYEYDARGLLVKKTLGYGTALAAEWVYQYDSASQLSATRDPLGAWTTFAYDDAGRMTSQTDANRGVRVWEYDAVGQLLSERDALGRTTRMTYDLRGRLQTRIDALGNTTSYVYDLTGNVLQRIDPSGLIASMAYNPDGQMTLRREAAGTALERTTSLAYDIGHNLIATTDPLGRVTSYGHDLLDRNTTVTEAVGTALQRTSSTGYDAVGNVTSTTNPLGQVTAYGYDALNRSVSMTEASGTGLARTTTTTFDAVGNVLTVKDALNRVTSFGYDTLGRQTTRTDALGSVTTTQYDAVGRAVAMIDARGNAVRLGYDLLGRQVTRTDALGKVTLLAYDAAGNLINATDPLGNLTQFGYDALDRRLTTTDALGNVTTLAYDSVGNLVNVVEANGATSTVGYDLLHRQSYTIDALGNRATTTYDAADRVVTTVNALGRTATYGYDTLDRLVSTTTPEGNRSTLAYDLGDRLIASTDPLNHTTSYGYDALNRTTTTTDALGSVTTMAYDTVDNVVSVTDALAHTTSFGYDALDRRITTTDALAKVTTLAYDTVGNVIKTTDANGNVTSLGYDANNRLLTATDALGRVTSIVYDAAGNRLASVDALGRRTTIVYDALNRVQATVDALGNRATVSYDSVGNVIASTDALNHTATFGYDLLHRQTTMQDAAGFVATTVYDAVGNITRTVNARGYTTSYAYDRDDRIVSTTDALGNITTVVYDAAGNVVATVDAANQRTTFGYDALNRQVTTKNALGHVSTTAYDAVSNVIATTDANARTTTFGYDAVNRLVTVKNALSQVTTVGYDNVGNRITTTDALGRVSTSVYDALNRAVASVDALGQRSTITFDAVGNVVASTDANNHTTSFGYDALNRRVTTTDALSKVTTLVYDAVGNLVRTIDANARTTSYAYDNRNLLTKVTDALGGVTTLAYDGNGNRISTINAVGATTTTVYDTLDRAIATVDALGYRSTFAFDTVGNAVTSTDPLNRVSTYGYDVLHRLTTSTDPTGAVTSFGYDNVGNQTTTTNARGFTTTTVYDELDRASVTIDALGGRWTMAFDAVGNVIASTDANNHTTSLGYDALNRRITTTDANNHTTSTVYDAVGNVIASVDALGYRTTITFNARDEVVTIKDSGLGVTTLAFDNVGNRISTTDAVGDITTQVYDALNRVVNVIDGNGFTATYQYDAIGRLILQTDASGNTTTFQFDARNQLVRETDARGNAFTHAYDAAGQLISTTDRLARRKDYAYDAAGRLKTEKWYATGGALQQTQTLAYDAVGNLVTGTDPSGTISYAYDALNRLTREDGLFGQVLTHGYDAVGNRTVRQDNWGGIETFAYDNVDNLTSQRSTRSGGQAVRIDYAYTARDQLDSSLRYTDLTATTLRGTTSQSYDAVGRETHFVHKDGSGTTLSEGTYAYDVASRLTEQRIDGTLTTYTYDKTNQLTQEGTTTHGYDATGNRTNTGYATTTGNQVSASPAWTYAYDAEGNRTSKTNTSTGEYWTYGSDTANQLIQIKKYSAAGGTLLLTIDYKYDLFHRRIEEVRTDAGGTTTTRFSYDGDNVLADLDGSNSLVHRYIRDNEVDDVQSRVSAAGSVQFILADRQQSVLAVTDSAGVVVNRLIYGAFGNLVSETNATVGLREAGTGKEQDRVTGLRLHSTGGALSGRYVDPTVGAWTNEDPMRWNAGDLNLNRYVGNSPTNATDPTGHIFMVEPGSQPTWNAAFARWFGGTADAPNLKYSYHPLKRERGMFEWNYRMADLLVLDPGEAAKVQRWKEANKGDDWVQLLADALLTPIGGGQNIIGDNSGEFKGCPLTPWEIAQVVDAVGRVNDGARHSGVSYANSPLAGGHSVGYYTQAVRTGVADGGRMMWNGATLGYGLDAKTQAHLRAEYGDTVYNISNGAGAVAATSLALAGGVGAAGVSRLSATGIVSTRVIPAAVAASKTIGVVGSLSYAGQAVRYLETGKAEDFPSVFNALADGIMAVPVVAAPGYLQALAAVSLFVPEMARGVVDNLEARHYGSVAASFLSIPIGGYFLRGNTTRTQLERLPLTAPEPTPLPSFGATPWKQLETWRGQQPPSSPNQVATPSRPQQLGMNTGSTQFIQLMSEILNAQGGTRCFLAGTPLRTPTGWKRIEMLRPGEWVLSRDEHDVQGPVVPKQVEEVFVLTGRVWVLRVSGREISTTGEHPLYVQGRGWVTVAELCVGELLATESGEPVVVEDVYDTGTFKTVYNCRVADYHTYFVGCDEWGFSVWVHNARYSGEHRHPDGGWGIYDTAGDGGWVMRTGANPLVYPTRAQARAAANLRNNAIPEHPTINEAHQGKHIPTHRHFEPGKNRSELLHPEPQRLLDEHKGTGTLRGSAESGWKETVDFGDIIGNYVDRDTGAKSSTSRGTIHYNSRGEAHIVPSNPNPLVAE